FAKVGNQFFRSSDRAATWTLQGILPAANSLMAIPNSSTNVMYFVDAVTLGLYQSSDLGHSWNQNGALPIPIAPGQLANGIGALSSLTDHVYVSVKNAGMGGGAYGSTTSGGSFTEQTTSGLGLFSKMDSGTDSIVYAFAAETNGFYRS